MGWSCLAVNDFVLNAIMDILDRYVDENGRKTQNVYRTKHGLYMFETSCREHEDGAITGTIGKFVDNDVSPDNNRVKTVGSFRIANGKVERFLGLTKAQKKIAEEAGAAEMNRVYGQRK
jgi:hypothetical protein